MTWPQREDSSSTTMLQKLNDGIRENPVGAALVGLGIVWMLAGTSSMGAAIRAPAAAARGVPRLAQRTAEAIGDGTAQVASGLDRAASSTLKAVRDVAVDGAEAAGDAARATMRTIGSTAESTASAVGEGVSRIGRAVTESAQQVGSAAQGVVQRVTAGNGQTAGAYLEATAHDVQEAAADTFGNLHRKLGANLQAHPLLLGGIGLAIGAGLAALFPRTAIEARVMGEAADNVRARIDEMTGVAATKVDDTVREIGAQAREIGTTARAAAEDVAQKAKSVATAGRDAVAGRLG